MAEHDSQSDFRRAALRNRRLLMTKEAQRGHPSTENDIGCGYGAVMLDVHAPPECFDVQWLRILGLHFCVSVSLLRYLESNSQFLTDNVVVA